MRAQMQAYVSLDARICQVLRRDGDIVAYAERVAGLRGGGARGSSHTRMLINVLASMQVIETATPGAEAAEGCGMWSVAALFSRRKVVMAHNRLTSPTYWTLLRSRRSRYHGQDIETIVVIPRVPDSRTPRGSAANPAAHTDIRKATSGDGKGKRSRSTVGF